MAANDDATSFSDFSFVQDLSETSMLWAFVESYVQLQPFSFFVWASRHLPSFFGLKNFAALGAFGCVRAHYHVVHSVSNHFHSDVSPSHQIVEEGGEVRYGEG